ncbi:MAG: LysR family transcriptional regulator [Pseudomonadota bacterium]
MQSFDWALVQSFLAVAETGSHSAAARATGRSQPTIGRHIEALQDQLGATLFQRGVRGFDLTPTGTALMDHATAMRDAAAQVSLVAEGRNARVEGSVRLTASEIVATYILPPILADLLVAEPALQIELVASNSTQNLLRREADIAIRMTDPTQADLIARRVGGLEIGFYAAQRYLDKHGTPQGIADLKHHTLMGYDQSDLILRGMQAFGVDVSRSDFAFRCDDQVTYAEALIAGVGLGACPCLVAERQGLVRLFAEQTIPSLPVWLAAHQELRTSARVRRVFDFLADRLPATLSG